jgi:Fe-S cluster biosynthesis and repair protein YggX
MARIIKCAKLHQDLPAMAYKPFNDALGERIYREISMDAWKLWIEHSKMVVNERKLDLTQAKSHKELKEQCETFLFGEGTLAPPPDFVAPK